MKHRLIFAVIIVLAVLAIIAFIRLNQSSPATGLELIGNKSELDSGNQEDLSLNKENTSSDRSSNELLKHNSKADCWVAYDGKVYDITSFLPNHPGSAGAITPYCGTSDAFKNAFEKQHGTSKVNGLMKFGVLIGDFDIVGTSS